MKIDINYLMYSDTKANKDPDTYSHTLHTYHHFLWNKQLPNGEYLDLNKSESPRYILHCSLSIGDLELSSDSIIHTYSRCNWKDSNGEKLRNVINNIGEEKIQDFWNKANTIGGYIIFPSNKIDKQYTINQSRGINTRIRDRFDLTLECIRLWYLNKTESPLLKHIERYSDFFNLFIDFKGYVDFFLLNDLVDENYENIKFWLPFEDFKNPCPVPLSETEYNQYMEKVMSFVDARNNRILEYAHTK